MESVRIAMSPPQRALAGGPFILCLSREMPQDLLDASPNGLRMQQWTRSFHGVQDEGRWAAAYRPCGFPGSWVKVESRHTAAEATWHAFTKMSPGWLPR